MVHEVELVEFLVGLAGLGNDVKRVNLSDVTNLDMQHVLVGQHFLVALRIRLISRYRPSVPRIYCTFWSTYRHDLVYDVTDVTSRTSFTSAHTSLS